jgi:hypothetical protein
MVLLFLFAGREFSIMSKFKKCENCGITVTKIKRSRFDNMNGWDAIRWQRPTDPGDADKIIGHCNDGSSLKLVSPTILLCKTCIECYDLFNLEIDIEKKEWIIPEDIEKIFSKPSHNRTASLEQKRA